MRALRRPTLASLRRGRFLRDRRGVSAIEFALIAPVLLTMCLGVAEVGRYIHLRLKITNAASNVSDLVARMDAARASDLDGLFKALPVMLDPFEASDFRVIVTAVTQAAAADADADPPAPVVAWRRESGALLETSEIGVVGGAPETAFPKDLLVPGGDAVIVAEVFFDYDEWLFGFVPSQTVTEISFSRPRRATLAKLE